MERRVAYVALSFTIALLLAATWFIAGCGQEQSPTAPDQEDLQAPGNGKGASSNGIPPGLAKKDGNKDKDKPKPEVDDDEELEVDDEGENNGQANGKNKPKGNNGKAKGKNKNNGNNGKAKGKSKPEEEIVNDEPDEPKGKRGAVKEALLNEGGTAVGWAIANTTANGDDEDEEDAEVAIPGDSGNVLIVTVHLDNGAPSKTFDIVVYVDGVKKEFAGALTTNHKGKGTAQVRIPLDITAENADSISVMVSVKNSEDYETPEFDVALKMPKTEEEL